MENKKCVAGCKRFTNNKVKHHKDCPNYVMINKFNFYLLKKWYRLNVRNRWFNPMKNYHYITKFQFDTKNRILKSDMIEIAQVGFPERVKHFIDFDNLEMMYYGGVFRLYDRNFGIGKGLLPKEDILAIHINEEDFVQFVVGIKAFDHYAAIRKMIDLGII